MQISVYVNFSSKIQQFMSLKVHDGGDALEANDVVNAGELIVHHLLEFHMLEFMFRCKSRQRELLTLSIT